MKMIFGLALLSLTAFGDDNSDPDPYTGPNYTGPKVFHYSKLEVLKRYAPSYPEQAKGMGFREEERCKVTVRVSEQGIPYDTTVTGCPEVFHESASSAIMRWRWRPVEEDGQIIEFQTTIVIKYIEILPKRFFVLEEYHVDTTVSDDSVSDHYSGPKRFSSWDLEVLKRYSPSYPEEAKDIDFEEQRCLVTVRVSELGIPYDTTVSRCAEVFHESASSAVMQWRWRPVEEDSQKIEFQTSVLFKYTWTTDNEKP